MTKKFYEKTKFYELSPHLMTFLDSKISVTK